MGLLWTFLVVVDVLSPTSELGGEPPLSPMLDVVSCSKAGLKLPNHWQSFKRVNCLAIGMDAFRSVVSSTRYHSLRTIPHAPGSQWSPSFLMITRAAVNGPESPRQPQSNPEYPSLDATLFSIPTTYVGQPQKLLLFHQRPRFMRQPQPITSLPYQVYMNKLTIRQSSQHIPERSLSILAWGSGLRWVSEVSRFPC